MSTSGRCSGFVLGAIVAIGAVLSPSAWAQSDVPHARTQIGRPHAHDPVWSLPTNQRATKVYYSLVPPPEMCDSGGLELDSIFYGSRDRVSRVQQDSTSGSTLTISREYDQKGNLTRREQTRQESYDFHNRDVFECEYDSRNLLIRKTSEYSSSNDPAGVLMVYRATYNLRGQFDTETYEYSSDGVVSQKVFVSYVYDDKPFLVLKSMSYDSNVDGVLDSTARFAVVNDHLGRPIRETQEFDFEPDGIVDVVYTNYSTEWDQNDNIVSDSYESDGDIDGIVDIRTWDIYTYDRQGNQVLWVFGGDFSGPGGHPDGVPESYSEFRTEYDVHGNPVHALANSVYFTPDPSITFPSRWEYFYEWDQQGHFTRMVATTDYDADGVVDVTDENKTIWEGGRIVEIVSTSDSGYLVIVNSTTSGFDSHGNLVELVERWFYQDELVQTNRTIFEYDNP
jgi:hypothetical protein